MKSITLFPLVVLILGTLAPRAVEGVKQVVKAGACPPVYKFIFCSRYEKPQCQSDLHCPGKQKCCQSSCFIRCTDPVELSIKDGEKPGKCPKGNGQCMMLEPHYACETDGQCQDDLKCCEDTCGKFCSRPLGYK